MPKEFLMLRKVRVTNGNIGFDGRDRHHRWARMLWRREAVVRCPRCAARTSVIGCRPTRGVVLRRKRAAAEAAPQARSFMATITPAV
jgi:hypothetical protein